MRILITGAGGFVGKHAINEFLSHDGYQIIATDISVDTPTLPVPLIQCNIVESNSIETLIAQSKPDACLHLAAISYVPDGMSNAANMFSVNVIGTINLLESLHKHSPQCKTLIVSTAHVYGTSGTTAKLTEESPFAPTSLYAISKACAEQIAFSYFREFGMNIITARPNNHTGPGQSIFFSVPSFAYKIKHSAHSNTPIKIGNLESVRDFSDVRDVVRAYRLIIEKGKSGLAYNISSHNFWRMKDIFNFFCNIAGFTPITEIDQKLTRPTDRSPILDTTRINKEIGWEPTIPFEKTLRDIWESL